MGLKGEPSFIIGYLVRADAEIEEDVGERRGNVGGTQNIIEIGKISAK